MEVVGVNENVILKWIFRKWVRGMDWIDLTPDRDRFRALVITVINRLHKIQGISGIAENRLAAQE